MWDMAHSHAVGWQAVGALYGWNMNVITLDSIEVFNLWLWPSIVQHVACYHD